jgi:LPXTG-motif cell wall-anchored protein
VTVTDIAIDDAMVTGLAPVSANLAPGETAQFTADPYTVTDADDVAGKVTNRAVARGTSPAGAGVASAVATAVTLTDGSGLALTGSQTSMVWLSLAALLLVLAGLTVYLMRRRFASR